MKGGVLLTGSTGFLGLEVLSRLVEKQGRDVIVLIRARDQREANARLNTSIRRLYDVVPEGYDRVRAIPGDLNADGLGLSAADRGHILAGTETVVHCAASIRFDLPFEEAVRTNVAGTDKVLDLAEEIERSGNLEQVVHVSTAYVSGSHEGPYHERDLDLGQRFRNTYEQSKFLTEKRIGARALPLVIVRPSIVVGESTSGWTSAFNVVYWPLQAFARGMIRDLPADPSGIADIVPVDYVAEAIACLAAGAGLSGTIHLVAGEEASTVGELIGLASVALGKPPPELVAAQTSTEGEEGRVFIPYFDVKARFADARAREYLTPRGYTAPALSSYFTTIMDYARRSRWGKRPLTRERARELAL